MSSKMKKPSFVDEAEGRRSCVVDSSARWRVCWDMVSIFLTVVMLVCEPFIAAFSPNSALTILESFRGMGVGENHTSVVALRLLNMCWFSLDILLTFFTSYAHSSDGVEVRDLSMIAKHYARGYLACDIFSTVPWETIILAAATPRYVDGHDALAFLIAVVPVARAIRVSKLAKARQFYETMPNVSEIFGLSPAWDTLLWFTVSVLMLNHWVACGWYALGDRYAMEGEDAYCAQGSFVGIYYSTVGEWFETDSSEWLPDDPVDYMGRLRDKCTWLQVGGYMESSEVYLYVTSMYWSMTTLTTIGYGDITPNTVNEKIYACVCYILGISMFASLVTSLQTDIFNDSSNAPIIISTADSSSKSRTELATSTCVARNNGRVASELFEEGVQDDQLVHQSPSTVPHHQYSKSQQRRVKKALKAFMYKKKVPMDLSSTIMSYLRRHFEVEQLWGSEDEFPEAVRLLKGLPTPLLRTLALHLFYQNPTLTALPFFDRKPREFIADCVTSMRSYAAGPDEVIIPQGSVVTSLHLVCYGACAVVGDEDEDGPSTQVVDTEAAEGTRPRSNDNRAVPLYRKSSLRRLTGQFSKTPLNASLSDRIDFSKGSHFGEEGIILGAAWLKPVVAKGWCKMQIIPQSALHLSRHVDVEEELRLSAIRTMNKASAASLLSVVSDFSRAESFGENFVGSIESPRGLHETKDEDRFFVPTHQDAAAGERILGLRSFSTTTMTTASAPGRQMYAGKLHQLRSQLASLRETERRAETRRAEERESLRRQMSHALDLFEQQLDQNYHEDDDDLDVAAPEPTQTGLAASDSAREAKLGV